MSSKKKRAIPLIAGVCAIAALGGAYAAITVSNQNKEREAASLEESRQLEEAKRKSLTNIMVSNVTNFSYITPDQEKVELTHDPEKDTWTYDPNPSFPLNQSTIRDAVNMLANLNANAVVEENCTDWAEYGLDKPSHEMFLTEKDNVMHHISLGKQNSVNSQYYMRIDDDPAVYLIGENLANYTMRGVDYLLKVETVTMPQSDSLTSLTYAPSKDKTAGWSVKMLDNTGYEYNYFADWVWFYDDAERNNAPADHTKSTDLMTAFSEIQLYSGVYFDADEKKLEEFGLTEKNPATAALGYAYVESVDTGKKDENGEAVTESVPHENTLLIGKQAYEVEGKTEPVEKADERYYVRLADSTTVYAMYPSALEKIITIESSQLYSTGYAFVLMDEIENIDVNFTDTEGKKRTINYKLIHHPKKDEESGEETDEIEYFMNGVAVESKYVVSMYYQFVYLTADRALNRDEKTAEYDPALEIVYHLSNPKWETVTIGYTPFDNNYYQVTINGEDALLINKREIESINSDLTEAIDLVLPTLKGASEGKSE